MICSRCGNEIENDSKYCNYCGSKVDANTRQTNEKEDKDNNSGCGTFLIVLLVMGAIIGLLFAIVKINMNEDSNGNIIDKIVERDITKSDYSLSTSQGLTSYSITITPNKKLN